MRIDFHGLAFDTPRVTFYLWSPWRASALEHRLFEAVTQAIHGTPEERPDELALHVTEPKSWRAAQQALLRVLKGWQEEADASLERRAFRWILEGDTDNHGYDSFGEPLSLWVYLQVGLDHRSPDAEDKGEEIELEEFGLRVWGASSSG